MRVLIAWLVAVLALWSAPAQAANNVPATLVAETSAPAAGSTVTLAFVMRPQPGWHGYWINPGDAGVGLQLKWDLPPGVTAAQPRFPVPTTLLIGGLMNYVYEREHVVLVDLSIDRSLTVGTVVPVKVRGDWLACTDKICVPEGDDLSLELRIGGGEVSAADRERFDAYRAAIPAPLDRRGRYRIDGKRIEFAVPYPASARLDQPYIFPLTLGAIHYAAPQSARRSGDWLVIESELTAPPEASIEGLVRIGDGEGLMVRFDAGPIPTGGEAVAAYGPGSQLVGPPDSALPLLLLGALLGGLILNLMPCVFPILGLKAIALAKAGGEEAAARREALAYTLGAVLSCAALGGAMLALRAVGQEVGWAFQLQEPAVVHLLLLLMVAITANLAGLFEIGSLTIAGRVAGSGASGAFWTGALAAFVATPCTGPFMAAALGAALLLPVAPALLLFAALGLGLALPFLALAYIPALRRRLPRPGPWMESFRKAMAIPMGLTAVALLWLLSRVAGPGGLVFGVMTAFSFLLLVSMIRRLRPDVAGGSALSIGLTLALMGAIALPYLAADRNEQAASSLSGEAFSEERLSSLRAAGKPAFVYFTADWCVTCKVNEAAAINREETAKLFREKGITVMVGDFTRRDPVIARFLARHGRSGVPLYLYYPAKGEPQILPQLLTPAIIADAVGG